MNKLHTIFIINSLHAKFVMKSSKTQKTYEGKLKIEWCFLRCLS